MDQHVIKMFFIYAQIIIFITLTRTEMYVKHFKYKRIQRGLLRHLDTAALCWFIFKVICFLQPLFPSLPLSLTASVEKVLSSGICNFTDITVEQMASVHSPLNISLLHLSACSFTLPVAFSLTHALIQSLRLSLYDLSRGFISLAAFCLSLFLFFQPLSSHLTFSHSPFPFISHAWWSRKSRSILTRTSTLLPPPISELGSYVSPKTNGDLLAFAADMSHHPKFTSKNRRKASTGLK